MRRLFALFLLVGACQSKAPEEVAKPLAASPSSATSNPKQAAPEPIEKKSVVIDKLPPDLDAKLKELVQPVIDDQWAMSIIVGVIAAKEERVFAFGKISASDPRPPDESTLYEIGSMTKIFTTTLLSQMVLQKEVALDDPIQKYLPEGVTAPKRFNQEITLQELATHTSGIPAVADNFWPKEPGNIYDPNFAGKGWSSYTEEKLYAFLKDPSPGIFPFKRYVYSNMGMGLLGHLLANKSGKTYEQLLIDDVLTPLHLESTRITLSDEMKARFAPGHDADNVPTTPWTSSALDGAFALRSSMHDLMLFAKENIGLIDSPLYPAMQAAHQEIFKKSQYESEGLGWNRNVNGVIFHSGTTGGYRSALFFMPDQKIGVVVLTNSLVGGSTDGRAALFDLMSASILNIVASVPVLPVNFPKVGAIKGAATDYVGQYGEDKKKIVVTEKDGELYAVLPERVINRVYPESDDIFFMKSYDARLVFTRDATGKINALELTMAGVKQKGNREQGTGNGTEKSPTQ